MTTFRSAQPNLTIDADPNFFSPEMLTGAASELAPYCDVHIGALEYRSDPAAANILIQWAMNNLLPSLMTTALLAAIQRYLSKPTKKFDHSTISFRSKSETSYIEFVVDTADPAALSDALQKIPPLEQPEFLGEQFDYTDGDWHRVDFT